MHGMRVSRRHDDDELCVLSSGRSSGGGGGSRRGRVLGDPGEAAARTGARAGGGDRGGGTLPRRGTTASASTAPRRTLDEGVMRAHARKGGWTEEELGLLLAHLGDERVLRREALLEAALLFSAKLAFAR